MASLPSSVFIARSAGTTYRRLGVAPLAGALGAEISGVDLSERVDDETIAEIRGALLNYLVVFSASRLLRLRS